MHPRREAAGLWVSGKGGIGGAWPVRTQQEKDERGKVPVMVGRYLPASVICVPRRLSS